MPDLFRSLSKKLWRKGSTAETPTSPGSSQSGNLLSQQPSSNSSFRSMNPFNQNPITPPTTEAPPAYTAAPTPSTSSSFPQQSEVGSANKPDDAYDFLKTFDTIFLIDDSGSMAGRLWRETSAALQTITPVCTQHDADGIDIYFLNQPDSPIYKNVKLPSTVQEIFQTVRPQRATPTGQKLRSILRPYLAKCERNLDATKPINIIVITDGVPTDDVDSVIIWAAQKLDKLEAPSWQVGIQFFQVGWDPGARAHLKSLDDDLKDLAGGAIRDIVDTVPFLDNDGSELNGEGVLKVVLGSTNRRLDRRSGDIHRK